jgi:hypothetical protein
MLYDHVFVAYILQMFNVGVVSGTAGILSVFNFGPHIVKQDEGTLATASLIPTASFIKVVTNNSHTWMHFPEGLACDPDPRSSMQN